jgi:sugar (pentulose or hexulose) kinase
VDLLKYLLGIDVGTTGTKSLLFSEDGKLLGSAYCGYPTAMPKPSFCEQNADDWWNAVVKTVKEVCAELTDPDQVAGISLSVQGGTMVAVDENLQQIRPAIVWSDKRCAHQRESFLTEVGDGRCMYEKTGWNLDLGLNALQIRWMRDNEPALFEKTHMFLSVPDYISAKLTGIAAVDISNGGINQLVNIREGVYDQALLDFAGIGENKLPKLIPSGECIGNLTAQAAKELGLSTSCVVVSGAHDQYAVALGAGACNAGDILIGTGTAWVVTAMADAPDFSSGRAQSVSAVPGKWGTLWSLASGGVCLEWLRNSLSATPDSYDEINQQASQREAAAQGLFFYPFTGRATLEKDFQRGSFVGLSLSHDRFSMARAIMEGVAFQINLMLESFQTKPSSAGLKLAGGATKSDLWCQIMADISGIPVRIPEVADLACVGAAVLAGTGCGIFGSLQEGCDRLKISERVIAPTEDGKKRYQEYFSAYKAFAEKLGDAYDL